MVGLDASNIKRFKCNFCLKFAKNSSFWCKSYAFRTAPVFGLERNFLSKSANHIELVEIESNQWPMIHQLSKAKLTCKVIYCQRNLSKLEHCQPLMGMVGVDIISGLQSTSCYKQGHSRNSLLALQPFKSSYQRQNSLNQVINSKAAQIYQQAIEIYWANCDATPYSKLCMVICYLTGPF